MSDDTKPDDGSLLERAPFGDIHPVQDVEGIGSVYRDKLEGAGIVDTEQLWSADAGELADQLDVAKRRVRNWQDQAELMALDGIGPQYAEVLVRAGIRSIAELEVWEPGPLFHAIETKQEELDIRIQGAKLTEDRTAAWIEQATEHDPVAERDRR